jgi:signal transduction histidine kinase
VLVDDYHHRRIRVGTDPPIASLIAAPLNRGGTVVGALMVARMKGRHSFDQTDLEQLEAYAGHLGVALELNQSRADQAALAVLREHQRIAADLHDHVIQELFATGMGLQAMVYRVHTEENRQHLSDFVDAIDATIRRIRTTIFQLNRSPHGHGGLKERLLAIVEEARPALGYAAHAEFAGPLDQAVSPELADDVIAVAREALANAARHAQASSVRLRVTLEGARVTVEAIDNGRGMGSPTRSSGLANLRSRAHRHGGDMDIQAPAGGGTHVVWTAVSRTA